MVTSSIEASYPQGRRLGVSRTSSPTNSQPIQSRLAHAVMHLSKNIKLATDNSETPINQPKRPANQSPPNQPPTHAPPSPSLHHDSSGVAKATREKKGSNRCSPDKGLVDDSFSGARTWGQPRPPSDLCPLVAPRVFSTFPGKLFSLLFSFFPSYIHTVLHSLSLSRFNLFIEHQLIVRLSLTYSTLIPASLFK
jgi:hypothetical protein